MKSVGVIDVGSNTIKLLIARAGEFLPAEKVDFLVEETRIGEGMTGTPPTIEAEAIQRGVQAISRLVDAASDCSELAMVATSAVRDATNKQEFVDAVQKACGHKLRILSGDEEAEFIGDALRCDPALTELDSYSLLDLGGGSLECIQFIDNIPKTSESLQLGSVRLASILLEDRNSPLEQSHQQRISEHVNEAWKTSKFSKGSSPSKTAVLTGGAAKHLAQSLANRQLQEGLEIEEFSRIAGHLCSLTLDRRVEEYGIPYSRADIFPTALITLEASLQHLGCRRLYFSEYNLRYGVAAKLLEFLER